MCPLLPWEVLEVIIAYSFDDPSALYNFSLTCSQLRPRSLCTRFSRGIHLTNRNNTFAFCDYLSVNPHFRPFVRAITIDFPEYLAPFPLLHILPNLSRVQFGSLPVTCNALSFDAPPYKLHQSSLTCYERLGTHVETLEVSGDYIRSFEGLSMLLLAFKNLKNLICYVARALVSVESNAAKVQAIKRRLSQRTCLKSLTVSLLHTTTIRYLDY